MRISPPSKQSEFHLGIGDDDPRCGGDPHGPFIDGKACPDDPVGQFGADDPDHLLTAYRHVVLAVRRLGGRREKGLGKPGGLLEARRKRDPGNGLPLRVILPARAAQVAPDDTLDREGLRLFHQHAPSPQDLPVGGADCGVFIGVRLKRRGSG